MVQGALHSITSLHNVGKVERRTSAGALGLRICSATLLVAAPPESRTHLAKCSVDGFFGLDLKHIPVLRVCADAMARRSVTVGAD